MPSVRYRVANIDGAAKGWMADPQGALGWVRRVNRALMNQCILEAPVDTGYLRNNHQQIGPMVVGMRVVGGVRNNTVYGPSVHNGHRAYTITPRRATALSWVPRGGGARRFARSVNIPAHPGQPWMTDAAQIVAQQFGSGFRAYT